MTKKLNLTFGGYVICDWDGISTVIETYKTIASTYDLTKTQFRVEMNQDQELQGVTFGYAMHALNETDLQTFNDTWELICTTYSIVRGITVIEYYTE